jgi:penicillin-binding protein 1A
LSWTLKKTLRLTGISVVLAVFFLSLIVGFVAAFVVYNFSQDLPELASAQYHPPLTTKVYDYRGRLISELQNEENRAELVSVSQIPRLTQLCFVCVEDERFYFHYGIDPEAIFRAVVANVIRGKKVQGGSTITMQLARNRFLTLKKTYTRKINEMIMSVRLERHYTKDEILAQYLNEIFFGGNLYGIASATKFYFGKGVEDLTLAESAILAGMLPAPNTYSPTNGTRNYKDRQRIVLQKMWQQGYITKSQALDAYLKPVRIAGKKEHVVNAPYFVEYVKKKLIERFGWKKALSDGMKVYTTLDLDMQEVAEECFNSAKIFERYPLEQYPDLQGAFLCLDPTDGSLKAMIGGRDFTKYKFNRATMARRQPGSAFKPIVYCQAINQGIMPNTIITDEPIRYLIPNSDEYWEPKNYDERFRGPVILTRALERSYNIVAIKLLEQVGVENVIALSRKLGIRSPIQPDLSVALGSSEATLLEMASAYGTWANEGILVEPRGILRVEDNAGEVVLENDYKEAEVLDETVAYIISHMLTGVVQRGTGSSARVAGHDVAGKTGTTQDYADAWFIAYTPYMVVASSFGFDSRKSLGYGQAGGTVAAPVVGDFLKRMLQGQEPKPFHMPEGVTEIAVCRDSGLLPLATCRLKVPVCFITGKEPTTYCNIHQPIGESLSDFQ